MADFFDSIVYKPVRLYPREEKFIEEIILGTYFPWFYIENQTFDNNLLSMPDAIRSVIKYTNSPYLSHMLLSRALTDNVSHLDRSASDFSKYYEFFMEIFHRFMVDNKKTYSKIFRANLNLSWFNGNLHTEPHYDHDWPHKNFIMYLNDCDNGQTIIWPEDFSASYMISCKKYHAVTFDSQWHGHRFPALGQKRIVFVVTYI